MTLDKDSKFSLDPAPHTWYNTHMKNKAFIFDLDGTLFETTAQEVESATGHARYVEFADERMLLDESKPLPLIKLAQQVQKEGHSVYILTARNSIIAPTIMQLLKKFGIEAEFVFTVGDRGFDIPAYKAEVLSQLAYLYGNTYFFDDEEVNLQMVPSNIRTVNATEQS